MKSQYPTEAQEQAVLFSWVELAKNKDPRIGLLFHIANSGGYVGGYSSNVARVMGMNRQGVRKGVPDLFLPVPIGRWHGLFMELKRQKGRVSLDQTAWIEALRGQGYCVVVCHGAQAAIDWINKYLGLE
jgi:hypothetical protein